MGVTVERMTLLLPDPVLAGPACSGCGGKGITGDQYVWSESTPELLVDVLCPVCTGCGSADHVGCETTRHAEQDDEYDEYDDEQADPTSCPSCGGRRWWACQGFTDTEAYTLRVPCGCSEAEFTPVPAGSAVTR
ncbi:hypothetical protein I6A60_01755 [Frankia sp. AgB1.9]|uniref:hypothetical protein n=1 Tax=unclassified Frankia TaxID=2632575 RepID=UPI001931EB03|nr:MULTISPECIES: hypothetical protein [unclassified Frankia]MBL7491332.1 hypothetical protein [Frankia sp. AgW1.1]MBL7546610.1 hypothetical protein [Frankia sp. AgB1.9]MBL7622404.1 hypothetical protein [Frankia sp. AgB1.8]